MFGIASFCRSSYGTMYGRRTQAINLLCCLCYARAAIVCTFYVFRVKNHTKMNNFIVLCDNATFGAIIFSLCFGRMDFFFFWIYDWVGFGRLTYSLEHIMLRWKAHISAVCMAWDLIFVRQEIQFNWDYDGLPSVGWTDEMNETLSSDLEMRPLHSTRNEPTSPSASFHLAGA